MTTPIKKRTALKTVLLVLALGPLPVGAMAVYNHYTGATLSEQSYVASAFLGSLWGLTAGVLRRSLLRALIGLNWGAFVGYGFGQIVMEHRNAYVAFPALVVCGMLLGAGLNMNRTNLGASLLRGALAGLTALGVIGGLAALVAELFRPDLVGWTIMCLIPFSTGMWIFIRLLGQPENIASPPTTEHSSPPTPL